MDYIKQNLGPNKVTVVIKPNEFEETIAIDSFPAGVNMIFKDMDNLIDNFRAVRGPLPPQEKKIIPDKHKEKYAEKLTTKNVLFQNSSAPIHDHLMFTLLLSTDPLLELHRNEEINTRVQAFKDDMIKNLQTMHRKLDLHKLYSEHEIISAIKLFTLSVIERKPLIVYFSRLVNKCIAIENQDGTIISNNNACSEKGLYLRIHDEMNKFEIMDKNEFNDHVMKTKVAYYLKNNYLNKLDTLLVKDLKATAEDLEICIVREEDGKKKPLLKNDLKQVIKEKLNC